MNAQTFSVLHTFTGGSDGGGPEAGVVIDGRGNLLGTAGVGGLGYGTAFKMNYHNGSWLFLTLHQFAAGNDGAYPAAPLFISPSGGVYGTTIQGGGGGPCVYDGCGTVFELQPPLTACAAAQCPWTETVLYHFQGALDGAFPGSGIVTDAHGNLYGEALSAGDYQSGGIFELQNVQGNWIESVPYSFTGGNDGVSPIGGLIFDASGNLYGTTDAGGASGHGTVFQLYLSGSTWMENTLYTFPNGQSSAGLVMDPAGNLYGDQGLGGCCNSGQVFEVTSAQDGWNFANLYSFDGPNSGPTASLVMDAQGNLYGTTYGLGANNLGNVFELTPSNGSWIYTDLHDFTGGSDGSYPLGALAIDSHGNLYGTTSAGANSNCGGRGCGVVFEITPGPGH